MPAPPSVRVLGIETSCDETAAAVVEDGRRILSNVVASQASVHAAYGGVVPEIAARHHIETIVPIVEQAMADAALRFEDLSAVAVTQGPGLVGSLLVGLQVAKSIALVHGKPLVPVHHVAGHIAAAFLAHGDIPLPAVALVVSGGHTSLYEVPEQGVHRLLGRTRDDAAGEAFDKVAKLLGLGYPGGPIIDRLSARRERRRGRVQGRAHQGRQRRLLVQRHQDRGAAAREARGHPTRRRSGARADPVRDLVASFQRVVVEALVRGLVRAARDRFPRSLILTGGVAANTLLRPRGRANGPIRGSAGVHSAARADHRQRRHDRGGRLRRPSRVERAAT